MCSIGEDDFGDDGGVHAMTVEELEKDDDLKANGTCKRCGKVDTTVYKVYLRGFECQECFLASTRHKFRATLGSSKILPRDAVILLSFDGTDESIVLLDMLHFAQSQNNFKRLHCKVKVLYIDETLLLGCCKEGDASTKRLQTLEKFKEHFKNYELFDTYIVPLSNKECIKPLPSLDLSEYLKSNKELDDEFLIRIEQFKTLTSRQDFLKNCKDNLLASASKTLECPYVFSAEISNTLTNRLLTSIVLGRGGSAALDVSLVDERHKVKLIRPLRDLNYPELQLYIRILDLKPLVERSQDFYGYNEGAMSSLQNLTKSFVDNLQDTFPATVSTVFRTGEKIAPNQDLLQQLNGISLDHQVKVKDSTCALCHSKLSSATGSTLLAIEFSKVVSQASHISLDDCNKLSEKANERLENFMKDSRLCHSCQNIEDDDIEGTLLKI